FFHERACFDTMKQKAAEALAVKLALVHELQKKSHCGELQPKRRIEADLQQAVEDLGRLARACVTMNGIDPGNDHIALRHPPQEPDDGWISRKPAVPIWLAINFDSRHHLRQAG